ncbi:MAG: hypothetical protein JNL96_23265 [Planctomycetaceae bacterium]|nr:hypothetical protein [Planctomycetaceae bacterium]
MSFVLLCGAALVPLSILLASLTPTTARGAELSSSGFRKSTGATVKWRAAGSRTSQPIRTADRDASPELLSTDDAAKPLPTADEISAEYSTAKVMRDSAVVQVQAKSGANSALDDPFGDAAPAQPTTPSAAPRLLTEPRTPTVAPTPAPVTPAPSGGSQFPPLPSSSDQIANAGGIFQQEPCPQLSDLKAINKITNNIAASQGELPKECYFDESVISPQNRAWPMTCYMWKASGLCHKPLYFDEEALERYGHSTGPFSQPIVSGAHFFATLPVLPYKMGVNPPWECQYALGYYRPGSCAPYILPGIPINANGIAAQAAATAGVIYLFP